MAVYGHEPRREGEFPLSYQVGAECFSKAGKVTSIEERLQDLGDRGIQWFDVWCGERRVASLNATCVAEIHYAE